jgi:quercetin dioxygenase-like cupin family protein
MRRYIVLPLIMAAFSTFHAEAQETSQSKAAPKRTILQQADVAASPAQQTLFGVVEIVPGTGNSFHTHFGSEIGYVLQGHIRLEVKGQPSRYLGPGDSFMVPRGVVHRSVLIGNQAAKLLNTWTVDKDSPLLTPAPVR